MSWNENYGCFLEEQSFKVRVVNPAWDNKNHRGPQPGEKGRCIERRKVDGEWYYYLILTGRKGTFICYEEDFVKI